MKKLGKVLQLAILGGMILILLATFASLVSYKIAGWLGTLGLLLFFSATTVGMALSERPRRGK